MSDRQPSNQDKERRQKKLELLMVISIELSKQPEVDRLLEMVVAFTFQVMNVDRVSLLLVEEATGELAPKISRGRTAQSAARPVSQSIARKVIEDRIPLVSDELPDQPSAMCTPLVGTDQKVLGILYVDSLTAKYSFADEDLEFLFAVSSLAAVRIENSRLSERIRREVPPTPFRRKE